MFYTFVITIVKMLFLSVLSVAIIFTIVVVVTTIVCIMTITVIVKAVVITSYHHNLLHTLHRKTKI